MRFNFGNLWSCAAASAAILAFATVGAAPASSQDEQHDSDSRRRELLEGPEQMLSVDETLGAVFNAEYGGSWRKYYARANPEAKDVLYRVLDNEELKEFHDRAWNILGYIGGNSHVQHVEEAVKNFKPIPRRLEPNERDTLRALFNSLGVMCGREVDSACDLAEKMMDPTYWRDAKFRLSSRPRSEYRVISELMFGYALSLDPEIGKHGQSILEKIDDPQKRDIWRKAFSREAMLRIGWNTRYREVEPVTPQERRDLASYFNGDLKNPGPARPPRHIAPGPPAADQRQVEGIPPPRSLLERLKRIAHEIWLNADGSVEYIHLRGEDVTNDTLTLLRETPQLQSLVLENAAVNDEGLKDLPRHAPQLRSLSLTETEITDEGLKHLQGLEKLTELALSQSAKISYRGMEHVGRLSGLTELRLWRLPNLTNQGFEDLRSLQNLQFLDLNELAITDPVLEHIAALGSLQKLYISSCPIEDRGLAHLRQVAHNLKYLRLRDLPLTNHALIYLQDLKHLEELSLKESGGDGYTMHVSEEAVQKLQEALPETDIRFSRISSRP